MTKRDNEPSSASVLAETETGWIEISGEVIDWVDAIAECYDMPTTEATERLLRHGAKNYEEVLGWDP